VGPRAGLDGCEKSRPPPGFNPQTVRPVASRYADYAIMSHRANLTSCETFVITVQTARCFKPEGDSYTSRSGKYYF
jgi:hypothetical protein